MVVKDILGISRLGFASGFMEAIDIAREKLATERQKPHIYMYT